MVRITFFLTLAVVAYIIYVTDDKSAPVQKLPGQSVIIVEELPPIREENK